MSAPIRTAAPHANVLRLLEEHGPGNLAEMDKDIVDMERKLAKLKAERSRLVSILSMNRVHGEMESPAEPAVIEPPPPPGDA